MKKIVVPLFNVDVLVYTGDKGRKAFEKAQETLIESTTQGCVQGSSVWFNEDKPSINVVVHEVSHLAYEITAHRGIHDEETRAYITGFLAEEICKCLKIL